MVDVNTQNKTISVNVSSSGVSSNVNASGDTSHYYSEKAREWAISNRIVDGVDYSSKYYANKSNQSALNAQSFAQSAQDSYNNFQQSVDGVLSDIDSSVQEGVDVINNTKTEIINDIELVANGEKQEIEELADLIKENAEEIANRTSFAMFDTILKDHILTYEESKGLALQGTYVYKDAIAGSRYGYQDFYNKVIEEKESAAATEVTLGDTAITMYIHSNGHQYYDIADKEIVDSWFNTYGTAWFYGIDTENERIYLPRNNYFEQATGEIPEVGQSVEAGLPNITGSFPAEILNKESLVSGAFYHTGEEIDGSGGTGGDYKVGFDASRCSSVYGNSDTVQPNAVKKLLYICVGNTETVSSITDVVDVTTTENDTTPLFTGMYFEFTPNNVSWLKAGEQANSGGIYTTCYNELVNELVSPKYGLKVINESDMIVGIDYSEYWKVNQDDMTFTTPTRISYLPISADSAKVYGDGNALVYSNGTDYINIQGAYASGGLAHTQYAANGTAPTTNLALGTSIDGSGVNWINLAIGIAPKSLLPNDMTAGLVADLSTAKSTTAQLYFKVANAVQNLELLDAGEVLEAVSNIASTAVLKTDCPSYIIESYVNGESGYNIYSNGYVEQWGIIPTSTTNITFLKEFLNTQYSIVITYLDSTSTSGIQVRYVAAVRATTGFKTQSSDLKRAWQACGYIA